jgi:hypothetical protein
MIDWKDSQFPVPYALKRSRGVYEELDMLWKDAKEGDPQAIERVKRIYNRLIGKKHDDAQETERRVYS